MERIGVINRQTNETNIELELYLDGGVVEISTGIGFFDHMLNSFAHHGGFGLIIKTEGDLIVDCHHTVEDTAIVLGLAIKQALGAKHGINRFGEANIPMDEALAFCAIDVSSRPFLVYNADIKEERVGDFDTCMTEEFFRALAFNAGLTLHIDCKYGKNAHHMIEVMFKAFAHALRKAVAITGESILSTKGTLD